MPNETSENLQQIDKQLNYFFDQKLLLFVQHRQRSSLVGDIDALIKQLKMQLQSINPCDTFQLNLLNEVAPRGTTINHWLSLGLGILGGIKVLIKADIDIEKRHILENNLNVLVLSCANYMKNATTRQDLLNFKSYQQIVLFLLFYGYFFNPHEDVGQLQCFRLIINQSILSNLLREDISSMISYMHYLGTDGHEILQKNNPYIQCRQVLVQFIKGESNQANAAPSLGHYLKLIMNDSNDLPGYLTYYLKYKILMDVELAVIRCCPDSEQAVPLLTSIYQAIGFVLNEDKNELVLVHLFENIARLIFYSNAINLFYDPDYLANFKYLLSAVESIVSFFQINHFNYDDDSFVRKKIDQLLHGIDVQISKSFSAQNQLDVSQTHRKVESIFNIVFRQVEPLLKIAHPQLLPISEFLNEIMHVLKFDDVVQALNDSSLDNYHMPTTKKDQVKTRIFLANYGGIAKVMGGCLKLALGRIYQLIPASQLSPQSSTLEKIVKMSESVQVMGDQLNCVLNIDKQHQDYLDIYAQSIYCDSINQESQSAQAKAPGNQTKGKNTRKNRQRKNRRDKKKQQGRQNAALTNGQSENESTESDQLPKAIARDHIPEPLFRLLNQIQQSLKQNNRLFLTGGAVLALLLKQPHKIHDYDCLIDMDLYKLKDFIEQELGWIVDDDRINCAHPLLVIDLSQQETESANCIIEISQLKCDKDESYEDALIREMHNRDFKPSALFIDLSEETPCLHIQDKVDALSSLAYNNISTIVPEGSSASCRLAQDPIRLFRIVKYKLTYPELKINNGLDRAIKRENTARNWRHFIYKRTAHQGQIGTAFKNLFERFAANDVLNGLMDEVNILPCLVGLSKEDIKACQSIWSDYIDKGTTGEDKKLRFFWCVLSTYSLRSDKQVPVDGDSWPFYNVVRHVPRAYQGYINYITRRTHLAENEENSFALTIIQRVANNHPVEPLIQSLEYELGLNSCQIERQTTKQNSLN